MPDDLCGWSVREWLHVDTEGVGRAVVVRLLTDDGEVSFSLPPDDAVRFAVDVLAVAVPEQG